VHLYTFYVCNSDGSSATLEAHEHEDDLEAGRKAVALLEEHQSCDYVAIWAGERFVENLAREHHLVTMLKHLEKAGGGPV
jgi:hypothetical protein